MAFNLALNTIKSDLLKALQPEVKKTWHCELCNGRITASELKRFSVRAPGILLTVLNVDGWDERYQTVSFAVFTLGKDQAHKVNNKQQMISKGDIAEALAMMAMDTALNIQLPHATARPSQFRAQNLYSGGVHDQAAALWGVTWKQQFDLKPEANHDNNGNSNLVNMVEVWLRPTDGFDGPYAEADIDVSQPPQGEISNE